MALYFLTYDVRADGDYQRLYDELAAFDAVRILESTWCFNRTGTNPENLRDHFRTKVDTNTGLIVSEVSSWASWGTDGNPNGLA